MGFSMFTETANCCNGGAPNDVRLQEVYDLFGEPFGRVKLYDPLLITCHLVRAP